MRLLATTLLLLASTAALSASNNFNYNQVNAQWMLDNKAGVALETLTESANRYRTSVLSLYNVLGSNSVCNQLTYRSPGIPNAISMGLAHQDVRRITDQVAKDITELKRLRTLDNMHLTTRELTLVYNHARDDTNRQMNSPYIDTTDKYTICATYKQAIQLPKYSKLTPTRSMAMNSTDNARSIIALRIVLDMCGSSVSKFEFAEVPGDTNGYHKLLSNTFKNGLDISHLNKPGIVQYTKKSYMYQPDVDKTISEYQLSTSQGKQLSKNIALLQRANHSIFRSSVKMCDRINKDYLDQWTTVTPGRYWLTYK